MKEETDQLYEQFLQLLSISENMQHRIISLEKANQVLVKSQRQFTEWMDDTLDDLEHYQNNLYFEIMDSIKRRNNGTAAP